MSSQRVAISVMIVTLIVLLPTSYGLPQVWNAGVEIKNEMGGPNVYFQCQFLHKLVIPRTLRENQIFHWNLEPKGSDGSSTHYSCVFGWNGKTASFPVWGVDVGPVLDFSLCKWKVERNGFWLYNPSKAAWVHEHAWGDHTLIAGFNSPKMNKATKLNEILALSMSSSSTMPSVSRDAQTDAATASHVTNAYMRSSEKQSDHQYFEFTGNSKVNEPMHEEGRKEHTPRSVYFHESPPPGFDLYNDLPVNDFIVNCASNRNQILAQRIVSFHFLFTFELLPNVAWVCTFSWINEAQEHFGKSVEVWQHNHRDSGDLSWRCFNCYWSIRADGLYVQADGKYYHQYDWDPLVQS